MSDTANVKDVTNEENGAASDEEAFESVPPIGVSVKLPSGEVLKIQVPAAEAIVATREFLLDAKETFLLSAYHLELDGKVVPEPIDDPTATPFEVPDGATLVLVEDDYDDRTARLHLQKLRDILAHANPGYIESAPAPSVLGDLSGDLEFAGFKEEKEANKDIPLLTSFYPKPAINYPKAVKSVAFSNWNAPPGHRKLQGDLFYLDVVTLEGDTISVTAGARGFFANNSKNGKVDFTNRDKNSRIHKTLPALLTAISNQFGRNFPDLHNKYFDRSGLEMQAIPYPVNQWLAKPRAHDADPIRAEEYLMNTATVDMLSDNMVAREWNTVLQEMLELPKETQQERMQRDGLLYKLHSEFVQYATAGVQAIANGQVPPFNPNDEKRAQIYQFNNIFFSIANDAHDPNKGSEGADEAAIKKVANDLTGLRLLQDADVDGLAHIMTAAIDYRGHRFVAQTLIPGLFQRLTKGEDNIDYGLLEPNGKKIINNEEFAELIRTKLATNLHLKEHKVRAKEDGSIHTVNASVETKGVKGTDNRKYLLDLIRMTPRDANYLGKHNDTAILRSELLGQYAATLMADAAREKLKEKRAAKAKVEDAEKPKKDNEEEDADELADEEFDMADMPVPDLKFNTDVFVTSDSFELADEPERIAEDEAEVKKLADFLKTEVIPLYCIEYLRGVTDSQTLTQSMHQMGINMRYLGEVLNTAIVMGAQFYRDVVMREMIVRSSKYILSYILQRTKTYDTASVLAQFLNSFFGRLTDNQKGSRSGLTLGSDKVENIDIRQEFELTHNNLWARIRSVVQRKYNFQLPEHIPATIFELSTLRALCLRNGIKLEARNYDLNMEKAFTADNIVDLLPIVKHSPPASKDIMEILATARNYSMHKRLDIAHDLFQEAVNLIPLVYGPLHRDTAQCYSNLALLVFNNLQDATQAEQLMTMACLISERVLGMDHSDTAHAYANLASMCFHNQKTKQGTNYILRALYILRLIGGYENPEIFKMYKDIGQFLQEASQFDAAIHYFKKALAQAEQMTGPGSNIVAIACHAIAFAYALTKNYRAALDYEKRNFAICQQVYGASAQRTVESNMCLSRWTKDAVDVEVKQRKEVKPASGAAAKKAGKDASGNVGHLPINEVLQFINTPSRKAGGKIAGRVGVSKAKRVGSTPAPAATTAAAKPASETKKTTAAKKAGNAAANNGKANGKSQQPVQKKADPSNDAVPPLI